MTDGEICRSFLLARNRRKQIRVLSDLTLKSPEQIREVLRAGGIDPLTPAPKPKKIPHTEGLGQMAALPADIRKEVLYEYQRDYKRRFKRF